MNTTPEIPVWIKDFRYCGYTNIFELLPDCARLYATETLFGDWDAETLLLAKDPAPTHVIKNLIKLEGSDGWRHAQRVLNDKKGVKTNERLELLANKAPGRKLYGSATAHMMCDIPKQSRTLPEFLRGPLHDHLKEVLKWVISNMPNLRVIACLGGDAWFLTATVLGHSHVARQWTEYRNRNEAISGFVQDKKLVAIPMYHPGARIGVPPMLAGWEHLSDELTKFL